jgi:hypothetical protein
LKFPAFKYEVVVVSDSQHQFNMMESVSDVRYKQCILLKYLFARKESVRSTQKQQKHCCSLGEKNCGFQNRKRFPYLDCSVEAVSSEMVQHADAIIHKD